MLVRKRIPLAPLTTFRIGGTADFFVDATSHKELEEALLYARTNQLSFFILGGGSNILISDEGRRGVVIHPSMHELQTENDGDVVFVLAEAGARWDDVIDFAVSRALFGIENLAGIPGTAGGAAVQNIGAYGTELSQVFAFAEGIRADSGESWKITHDKADFGYRTSIFKERRELVITRIALKLTTRGAPNLAYSDLNRARIAGASLTTPAEIAAAVRQIRSQKFPSLEKEGTAGSFFKNPVMDLADADALKKQFPDLPIFPQAQQKAKISLAWLLDHAMHLKGFRKGSVRLFERQPIVIVAERGTTASSVRSFAEEIKKRVYLKTNVCIEPEVELVAP